MTDLWHLPLLGVIWTGTQLRARCDRYLRSPSDTYDIYYENPALLPTIQTEAAEYPPGETWTLDEDRGDATIEDVCQFIVEYINSDVMVRIYVYIPSSAARYTTRRACLQTGTWSSQTNRRYDYMHVESL